MKPSNTGGGGKLGSATFAEKQNLKHPFRGGDEDSGGLRGRSAARPPAGASSLTLAVTLRFPISSLSCPQDVLARSKALWGVTGLGCWGGDVLRGKRASQDFIRAA